MDVGKFALGVVVQSLRDGACGNSVDGFAKPVQPSSTAYSDIIGKLSSSIYSSHYKDGIGLDMSVLQQQNSLFGLIFTLFILLFSMSAQAGERVALVIGNSNYQQGFLSNPVNDADDISAALKKLNFDQVTLLKNASRKTMLKAAQNFKKQLNSNTEVALFYYAGHGAQFEGGSYLLPLNANIESTADLPIEALKASDMLTQMRSSGSRVNVMVLDACRDLPFPQLKRGGTRGLARINASNGALVAYSTSPGSTAADGGGRNSPYTAALLSLLPQANLTLTQLFNDVGVAVYQRTGGKQTPEVSSLSVPRVYLAGQAQVIQPEPPVIQKFGEGHQLPEQEKVPPTAQKKGAYEPEMAFIQGGTFKMGCVSGKDCEGDETMHSVTVNDFWMGKYEVTFNEWQNCVNDGGCQSNKKPDDRGWGRGNRPVINVSWHDANEYAKWLSKKMGKNYRLPTEAEWEYAARAGSKTKYPWGNNISCSQADYNYKDCNTEGTSKVGSYSLNKWGLYDTVGNVYEWTCSADPKAKGHKYDGSETECANKNDTRSRVLRGGSWYGKPRHVRSANRYWLTAAKRNLLVGFRLSRTR